MLVLLMLINCLSVVFLAFLWNTLTWRYRFIFLGASIIPLIIAAILAVIYDHTTLPFSSFIEVVGFFFRGWFVACVASGTLACYIATELKK